MTSKRSVVFLNRFYWPDVAATGQMLTDLAEDLVGEGWDVTVVASRTSYEGGGARPPRKERRNGVRIFRVQTTRFGQHGLLGRAADYITYLIGALFRLLALPRPDAVVAMSDPPFLLAPTLLAGRLRRVQVVYWVQDVFPELTARLGVLRERGIAYRLAQWLARGLAERADAVVTLGPAMARVLVRGGAQSERVAVAPNWADGAEVRPVPSAENAFLAEHGLEGKFVILYSGNAGRAHTFDAVLEAERRLRSDPGVMFVFIGGGGKLPEIRAAAASESSSMLVRDYVSREHLAESLSVASVSLVTESPTVAGLLVPSKTYGIMASGRPLLFVGSEESDVAAIVREHGCGIVVSPNDPGSLVAAIERLRADPAEAAAMGARGRRALEEVYDRPIATRRWRESVERLLSWTRDPAALPGDAAPPTAIASHQ